jgi:hypothetical protein
MASQHGSRPIQIMIGLTLLSLLVGIFYVGATLPPWEQPHAAKEQPPAPESSVQSFRGTKTQGLEDLDELDAERVQPNAGASRGEDAAFRELLRIIEEDKERFPGPCLVISEPSRAN